MFAVHTSRPSRLLAVVVILGWWSGLDRAGAAEPVEPLKIANANARSPAAMTAYTEVLEHTSVKFEMLPIPGGTYLMGSPANEAGHLDDEGPQRNVKLAPFWMAKCEINWDAYDVWGEQLDILRRQLLMMGSSPRDGGADAVTRPTEPYTDMSFSMGKRRYPAICMTQHAARSYCKWLTKKTGRYYRLPTEAEWEYACRAGTTTAYHFGDDHSQLGEYAWYDDNSDGQYQRVGQKKPNPWGLHDMHGNVSEWVLDQYVDDLYGKFKRKIVDNPVVIPTTLYPRVVRGGGWDDGATGLRSAIRIASDEEWKDQDPQIPQSIWYHTDALSVGFRVVRPYQEPSQMEKQTKWEKTAPVQLDPEE
jgi:formylglycine-generating enzyme required for sulfatase activity